MFNHIEWKDVDKNIESRVKTKGEKEEGDDAILAWERKRRKERQRFPTSFSSSKKYPFSSPFLSQLLSSSLLSVQNIYFIYFVFVVLGKVFFFYAISLLPTAATSTPTLSSRILYLSVQCSSLLLPYRNTNVSFLLFWACKFSTFSYVFPTPKRCERQQSVVAVAPHIIRR